MSVRQKMIATSVCFSACLPYMQSSQSNSVLNSRKSRLTDARFYSWLCMKTPFKIREKSADIIIDVVVEYTV